MPPKKPKAPKVSPEELLEALAQAEAERCAEEQERFRSKAALELKEYNQRRMLLMETVKFFRRLEKAAADQRKLRSDRKEWTDFLSCRKSPDPTDPAELRQCLFRWTVQQDEREKSSVSWTLDADERSPLTQDPSRKRNTRKDLRTTFRNVGGIYLPAIREALGVLADIQDLGATPEEEVALARDEIRKFISDSLDRMTLRIGSNISRDMETLDPVMSEFQLRAEDVLAMYLWSFRPVPLSPDYNLWMKIIDMAPLDLVLHRPPAMGLKDCLIRGLWLQFDHFSNQDPTKTVPGLEPDPELIVAQELEWNERQDVRRKRLTTLRQLREEYEAEQRRREAEAEALEAQKTGPGAGKESKPKPAEKKGPAQGKKGKPPKQAPVPEPVPAVITDETEVDVDDEFQRQECALFWAGLASVAPESLPLEDGYINLREYAIVGGVYELARFERLPQPVELRSDFNFTNVPVGLRLTENVYGALEDEELIKIELQLPARCRWWEAPTVCRWEPWEQSDGFARLRPEVQQFHLNYDQLQAHQASLLFAAPERRPETTNEGPKIVQDFSLTDIPAEVRLHYLIRDHLLPRLPERYRFRAELRRLYTILTERAERRKAREREQMARNEMMRKYDHFVDPDLRRNEALLSEMRLPIDCDIDGEADAIETPGSRTSGPEVDEKLPPFSWAPPDEPRYLHPPARTCRSLIVGQQDEAQDGPEDELASEMEALVRTMQGCGAMLDDNADEQLCKSFSTFLGLLEYLREREKPTFPPIPPPGEDTSPAVPLGRPSIGKEPRRRHVEIRTTKKYPLGLGPRLRTLSGASESSLSVDEKKKRRRKKSLERSRSEMSHLALEPAEDSAMVRPDEVLELIQHEPGRWSTKPIRGQSYDPERRLLTFYTDRLGVYGLAARRYCNVPFLHWEIRRHGRVANLTTTVSVSTRGVNIVFYVTSQGYRVELPAVVPNPPVKRSEPPPEVTPAEGTFTLEELEKFLEQTNIHVFPQVDTCFYVSGMEATSSPKHQPMEVHNLRCLGVFCLTHNFRSCLWNRYANRRVSLVLGRELIEGRHEPEFATVMITPLKSQFVQVEELCSDALEDVRLAFHPRPEEQSYNADCYGLLKDALEEPSRKVLAKTPPLLQWNVGRLLQKLRLLSYS